MTGLRLPPVPVITRWNTWLETALFYRENFNQIKEFIESIKSDSKNESTKQIKRLVKEDKFIQELLEIKDYGFLMDSITKLQNPRLRLSEQKKVLDDSLDNLSGFAKQKLEKCLQKNKDLKPFCENSDFEFRSNTEFAPLVSVEVERSFSQYNNILTDKRHRFTEENIKMQIIIQYNSQIDK